MGAGRVFRTGSTACPKTALRARMETIFDWLKMNDFRDVLGSKMSTGMKQKASIARTIVHDPPVLIFDEPTSGLDVLVARAVLQNIIELRGSREDHRLLDALDARSRKALLAMSRSSTRGDCRPKALRTGFSRNLTSPISKSYSSSWSTVPTKASGRGGELEGQPAAPSETAAIAHLIREIMTRPFLRWSNLLVIFRREVRDQIRDRRTLFMIFVLPILLYPMLGIGLVQFAAALEQKPRVVVVVGAEFLANSPPLLNPSRRRLQPGILRFARRGREAAGAARERERPVGRPAAGANRRSDRARPRP